MDSGIRETGYAGYRTPDGRRRIPDARYRIPGPATSYQQDGNRRPATGDRQPVSGKRENGDGTPPSHLISAVAWVAGQPPDWTWRR